MKRPPDSEAGGRFDNTAALNTFDFNGHQLRTVVIEGEPWFHAVDILRCLGLSTTKGLNSYAKRLEKDERLVTPNPFGGKGSPTVTLTSESGLYKLIMRSDKATAAPFQNWVTREVIPSIRKTGGYLLNEAARTTAHGHHRNQENPVLCN